MRKKEKEESVLQYHDDIGNKGWWRGESA